MVYWWKSRFENLVREFCFQVQLFLAWGIQNHFNTLTHCFFFIHRIIFFFKLVTESLSLCFTWFLLEKSQCQLITNWRVLNPKFSSKYSFKKEKTLIPLATSSIITAKRDTTSKDSGFYFKVAIWSILTFSISDSSMLSLM